MHTQQDKRTKTMPDNWFYTCQIWQDNFHRKLLWFIVPDLDRKDLFRQCRVLAALYLFCSFIFFNLGRTILIISFSMEKKHRHPLSSSSSMEITKNGLLINPTLIKYFQLFQRRIKWLVRWRDVLFQEEKIYDGIL